ncbi:hypothetical protein IT398_00985 [Candidatus Nomurabacteria bacterium]|nr:hypothetical protein [Candidatus Nomurabacteria bacterium]
MKKINWKLNSFRPQRDWLILLVITALTIIAIFLIYFYLNNLIKTLPESQTPVADTASSTPRLTAEELHKYANEIDARGTKFESLLQSPPKISDPSI